MGQKGFTFLELTITLAVLALVFALMFSMPTDTTDHLTLEQSIYQLANDIIYAKEYAKTHNITLVFTISTIDKFYRIRRGDEEILRGYIPEEYRITVAFSNSGNQFFINNTGGVNAYGSITLTDSNGKSMKMITTIKTGRVRVE